MPLLTQTYEGTPDGMNLAVPAQEVPDTQARYLQDIMLHRPGLLVRRGPLSPISGVGTLRKPGTALLQTLDPNGNFQLAALFGDASEGKLGLFSDDLASVVEINWNGVLPNNPYRLVDSKAALTGGCWIGSSSQYDAAAPVQTLALWRGGNKADYTTGTITVARGSIALTGSGTSWSANVVPGMFVFANTDDPYTNAYIGVVKSVNSNTSITLGAVSPHPVTAKSYTITSIRGFCPRVTVGRITTSTGSTTVNGATTKFKTQSLGTGTWQLYRASDMNYIGKVSAVTSDIQLTLTANAALALNNERYIALRVDGDYSINTMAVADGKVGFLNAVYAERQWYANRGTEFELTSRVWFSDTNDPEAVDLSPFDGDFIDVASTHGTNAPIRALTAASNALIVLKDNEAFGIYGTSKSNFEVKKIEDDGTLSGMSVQPYGGGVIWAGRNGVWFYDGIEARNITEDRLGDYYKNALRSFDPEAKRMWSMVVRNHYFLFIESAAPSYAVVKGTTSTTPTKLTISINLENGAVGTHTNLGIRGGIVLPANQGETTWFLANSSTLGYVCDAAELFDADSGVDAFVCDPPTNTVNVVTNPSFETDASGWFGWSPGTTQPVIGVSTDPAHVQYGSQALFLEMENTDGVDREQLMWTNTVAVSEGEKWYLRVSKLASSHAGLTLGVRDNGGGFRRITTQPSEFTAIGAGFVALGANGQTLEGVWTVPAGVTTAEIGVYHNVPAGQTYYAALDGVMMARVESAAAEDIPEYTDGDQPYCHWDGTAHASTSSRNTPGPDFYIESKKYSIGDSLRKKLFKQLAVHYLAQGGDLVLDTVVGLNSVGRTSNTQLTASTYVWDNLPALYPTWDALAAVFPTWDSLNLSVFRPKRIKFLKRSQHLAFRIYQEDKAMTKAVLGPFQLGFKLQRPGRI